MFSNQELKARIEHEMRNLKFYALYWDILLKDMSERELEGAIDFHLDRLIVLLRLKGEKQDTLSGVSQRNFTILNV